MKINMSKNNSPPPPCLHIFPLLILTLSFSFLLPAAMAATPNHSSKPSSTYVQDACSVTRYIDDCVKSLSPFSNNARTSPSKWARAGVSVTVGELKSAAHFLKTCGGEIRSGGGLRTREVISTCVETIQDALDSLHQSLDVMRKLNRGEFDEQMNNVLTWMSAALTNEGTCADALDGVEGMTMVVRRLRRKLKKSSRLTSNALALVNKLAMTGLEEISITEENV